MRLEQLRYIVEIADTGSFTLASERLFIAQPSVSQAVNALEKELNMTLFTRFRTGTVPTAEGLIVIEHARRVLQEVGLIERFSQRANEEINDVITVGVIPTLCTTLLPRVMAAYKKRFPCVTIHISESGTNRIMLDCQKGNVDIGLVSSHGQRTPENGENFEYRFLFEGRLVAYVGKRSVLADKSKITFRELLPYQLMLFGDEFSLHTYCLQQISQYGTPNVLSTTRNPESIKRFVMYLDAVGFGPDVSLVDDPYVKGGSIIPIEISDASPINFSVLTNKKRKQGIAVEAFIKEIVSQSKSLMKH